MAAEKGNQYVKGNKFALTNNKAKKLKYEQLAKDQLTTRLTEGGVSEAIAKTVAETVVTAENDRMAAAQAEAVKQGKGRHGAQAKTEHYDHDGAAAFMMGMADPFAVIKDVAIASGIHPGVAHVLCERMRTKYLPVHEVTKTYDNKYFIDRIEEKMSMALDHMDEYAFATASLRDLATAFGILSEHRRLLNDEPTVILGVQERRDLNDLLPLVAKEAARRGITIDSTAEEVKAIPKFDRAALDQTYRRAQQGLLKSKKALKV